ncbi:nucleotide-sugar transporter-domain-containing protein [Phellopilus nigrolimitatus]|nr:nucleotide-sugar transporter-domain-containing protein [Phellopilus nigrolimitatus]
MGQYTTMPKLKVNGIAEVGTAGLSEEPSPRFLGMPLKYISLVTLAVQNASLTIIMHYSRVSTPPSRAYSAASAVLLNELLKGFISLAIAFSRVDEYETHHVPSPHRKGPLQVQSSSWMEPHVFASRCRKLGKEIFSPDCWKLSIPAILYVIQNNLQFVAASNLEAATFQVSYQMKILTTAAFSVVLLRRKLNPTKWAALTALALGVGVVQIQSGSGKSHVDSAMHVMHPLTGFMAVVAACFTSGMAGVYFEMVLKGSQTDLWVRNCQLSLFSLIPALVPVFASQSNSDGSWFSSIFANFGGWAWATVLVQVFGGLVTAIVIKYSDNILKGFATSLSIVISFLSSVALFNFHITPSFVVGASMVLAATWLYNQPENKDVLGSAAFPKLVADMMSPRKSPFPRTPVEPAEPGAPILGETDEKRRSLSSISPSVLSAALKLVTPRTSLESLAGHNETLDGGLYGLGSRTASANASAASLSDYQSRYVSRTHSPAPVSMPPNRLHSNSQLAVPSARVLNPQLQPRAYSGDEGFAVVNLDDIPTGPAR